jgi:hypothetical protein
MQNDQTVGFISIMLEPDVDLVDLRTAAHETTANATSIAKEDSLGRGDCLKLWLTFLKCFSVSFERVRNFICVAVECKVADKKSASVALGYLPDSSHPPIVVQRPQEPPACYHVLCRVVLMERVRFEIAAMVSGMY